jgi:hypothetical protein
MVQELYGPEDRKKLAIFTALTFSQKLSGLPPETIFSALLSDSLVAKGLVLGFVTDAFKQYLVENSLDDLVVLLKRAKMEDRLLDFFPIQKRTIEGFGEHFRLLSDFVYLLFDLWLLRPRICSNSQMLCHP